MPRTVQSHCNVENEQNTANISANSNSARKLLGRARRPVWPKLCWILRVSVLVALLLLLGPTVLHFRYNFHTVRPGQLYRCGQLPDGAWRDVLQRYHIRSVINLRGNHPERHWYQAERQAAEQLGIVHCDLNLSRQNLPQRETLAQLRNWHRTLPRPVLIHCEAGADRTSVVVVFWLLFEDDSTLEEARRQLGWLYLQLPWQNAARRLRRLLADYAAWLRENRLGHSSHHFQTWLEEHYSKLYEAGQVQ